MDIPFDVQPQVELAVAGDLPNFRHQSSFEMEGEREVAEGEIPYHVEQFIKHFAANVKQGNAVEIQACYESVFHRLTERYYKTSAWPHADEVSELCNHDPVFLILYRELYFRHVYSKLTPTTEQRVESWHNYCELFGLATGEFKPQLPLSAKGGLSPLVVPLQWMWDIIDEFIFQYQSFCQWNAKSKRSESDNELLTSEVWDTFGVLRQLHSLERASKINAILTQKEESFGAKERSTLEVMGYFSLIGQLRVHCMLGAYHNGLSTVRNLDFQSRAPFLTRVVGAYVTTLYYSGFAHLMLRRYAAAAQALGSMLVYLSRTRQYHTRSFHYDQILKKYEQMFALLALSQTLAPHQLDDTVASTLRDKYGDKMSRLAQRDDVALATMEDVLGYACPKFVAVSHAVTDDATGQAMFKQQLSVFLHEMKQQLNVASLRAYLKLYTSISTAKLQKFLPDEPIAQQLQCVKHKTRTAKGGLVGDVGFGVSGDEVKVVLANTRDTSHYGEFFVNHITMLEELVHDVAQDEE